MAQRSLTPISVGQRYGLFGCLTVTALAPWRTKRGYAVWLVDCICGNSNIPIRADKLKIQKSCGCLRGHQQTQWLNFNPSIDPQKQFWKSFWSKVDRSGGPNACWPWMASTTKEGY